MLRQAKHALGSSVAWTWANAAARMASAALLLPIVARFIPRDEMGLWYVFVAIGVLAGLMDLGFSGNVSRAAAYISAGAVDLLPFGVARALVPTAEVQSSNMRRLVATFSRFYMLIGLAMFVALSALGSVWVWKMTSEMPRPSIWRGAWVAYTSGCSLNFVAGFWLALLSGINRVRLAQQIQLSASIVNQIVSLAGVLAGLSAWALVIGNIAMGVTVFIAARTSVRACTGLRSIPASAADWSLVGVLWPNAWRMALVSVGGYCLTYANTLVCSSMIDLSHTASYGLSLQLIGMTAALSGAWVQVILPSLSARRVDSDGTTIAGKFAKRIRLFFLTYAAGGVLVVTAGPWMLNAVGAMTPLLPRLQLALMALYVFLEVHHTLYGALVLTENRNPFVVLALVSGACSIALSIMLTPRFGVWGLLVAPGIVQALCSNWWVVLRGIRGLGIPVRQYVRIVMALDRK